MSSLGKRLLYYVRGLAVSYLATGLLGFSFLALYQLGDVKDGMDPTSYVLFVLLVGTIVGLLFGRLSEIEAKRDNAPYFWV